MARWLWGRCQILSIEGFAQMGFALKDSVTPTCEEESEGCGDDEATWAVDSSRLVKWHGGEVPSPLHIPHPLRATPCARPCGVGALELRAALGCRSTCHSPKSSSVTAASTCRCGAHGSFCTRCLWLFH